jgi:cell volume regulation protein A
MVLKQTLQSAAHASGDGLSFDDVLLIGALVLLAGVFATRLSTRMGLPSLLLYLGGGVLLGQLVGIIDLSDADLARQLGTIALVLILIEGGLATPWRAIKPVLAPAAVLSTLGVVISVGVVAVAAHFLAGLDWQLSLLIGAIVSSTDAAAVFSQLRKLPLPHRLTGILEAESGINDAPSVILVTAFAAGAVSFGDVGHLGWEMGSELLIGTVVGIGVGFLGVFVLRKSALPAVGLYPIAAMSLGIAAYAGAMTLHGSGFLACYAAAVVIGNSHLPHRIAVLSFAEGLGWVAQIVMFVMLGLLVDLSMLLDAVVPALLIGTALLLVARPLSVLATLTPFRIPFNEQVFLSWAGLRGAVPIVLCTIPLVGGVPGAAEMFHVVFVLVAVFTFVQGPTLALVASKVGLGGRVEVLELEFDSAPLEGVDQHLLSVRVPTRSALGSMLAKDLALPPRSHLAMVVHGRDVRNPDETTRLAAGDRLVISAHPDEVESVEEMVFAAHLGAKLGMYADEEAPVAPPRWKLRKPRA